MDAKQKIIASHINEWEPQGIDHLISPHTDFLRELLEYYWNEKASGKEMAFPHVLMHTTRDGLGRSCIARLLSSELGMTYVEKVGYWLSRNGDELAQLFETPNTLLFLETNKYCISPPSVNLILQLLQNPHEVVFKDFFAHILTGRTVLKKLHSFPDSLSTHNGFSVLTFRIRSCISFETAGLPIFFRDLHRQ
jgi:hypothetical protein